MLCRILPTFISNGLIWKSLLTVGVMLTLQQQEGHRGKKKTIWRFRSVTVRESLKSEGHGGGSETLLTSLRVFPASAGEPGHEKGERRGGPLTASLSLSHTHTHAHTCTKRAMNE